MLIIGHQHDITFRVNVMGTSAEPTVKLCLGTTPELSFPARHTGEVWTSSVVIPTGMEAGSYPLRVEVVVNNRHFVPLTKSVDIVLQDQPELPPVMPVEELPHEEPAEAEVPISKMDAKPAEEPVEEPIFKMEAEVAPAPVEQPKVKKSLGIFQMVEEREPPPVRPAAKEAVKPVPAPVAVPKVSALDVISAAKKPELGALSKVVEEAKPLPKRHTPIVTPLPKPTEVKPAEIRVKVTDVLKIAEAKEAKLPKKAAKKTQTPVMELKTGAHVKLTKGEIIYE